MPRIVLFGATGYTGRLTAAALVKRGARPLLAARNSQRLSQMAAELGGLDTAVADVSRPDSVRELLSDGDVMLSTVGPFVRWGAPAVEAAIGAGAVYIDSTGEPPFIRDVFERYDAAARSSGSALLTAFGYDFVPGNLAAALVLERAGESAVRVAVGYFITGRPERGAISGGTMASLAGVMLAPSFAFRGGQIVTERGAKRVRTFDARGKRLKGVSMGSSEHFALPRIHSSLREVDAYLGWFGPASRAMQAVSLDRRGARGASRGGEALAPLREGLDRRPGRGHALAQRVAPGGGGLRRRWQAGSPASSSPDRTATRSPATSWPGAPSAHSSRECPAVARSVRPRPSGCASSRPAASNWAWWRRKRALRSPPAPDTFHSAAPSAFIGPTRERRWS